jgi:hypothetical protein
MRLRVLGAVGVALDRDVGDGASVILGDAVLARYAGSWAKLPGAEPLALHSGLSVPFTLRQATVTGVFQLLAPSASDIASTGGAA